jgi:hypothetical protein
MRLQRDLPRIDLRFAKLCMELDCNTVFDSAIFRHCPTCGSVEFYPLESWLNRERSEKAPVVIGNLTTVDRAMRVAAMPRPLWLERLRAKRAESDARLAAGPAKAQTRVRRRRAS